MDNTPRKPIPGVFNHIPRCPSCQQRLDNSPEACPACGQKIDYAKGDRNESKDQ